MQLEFRKFTPFGHALPPNSQANFEVNRPIRYQITAKTNYFPRQTDVTCSTVQRHCPLTQCPEPARALIVNI